MGIVWNFCKELDYPEDRVRFTAVAGQEFLNWIEVEDCIRRFFLSPFRSIILMKAFILVDESIKLLA